MVEGTINGFPFRAALEQTAKEVTGSGLTKPCTMLQGETLETRYGGDYAGRRRTETRVPMELRKALAAARRHRHCGRISHPWRARTDSMD